MPTLVTSAIKAGGGGDYTSLAAWNSDLAADIVAADEDHLAEVYGGGSVGALIIDNTWVTDATHRIRVQAAAGEGHSGVFNASKALISGADFALIDVFHVGYVTVGPGISVEDDDSGGTFALADIRQMDQPITLLGLVMRAHNASVNNGVLCEEDAGSATHALINCMIYDDPAVGFATSTIDVKDAAGKLKILGCVVLNHNPESQACVHAHAGAVVTSQDNYYFNIFTGGEVPVFTGTATPGTNDATWDAEAPTLQNVDLSTDNFLNVTFATMDLHLQTDSILAHAGVAVVGLDVDIDGEVRPDPPSVGADEPAMGGPTTEEVLCEDGAILSELVAHHNTETAHCIDGTVLSDGSDDALFQIQPAGSGPSGKIMFGSDIKKTFTAPKEAIKPVHYGKDVFRPRGRR